MKKTVRFQLGLFIFLIGAIFGAIFISGLDFSGMLRSPTKVPVHTHISPGVVLGSQENIPEELKQFDNLNEAFVHVSEYVVPTVVSIHSTRLIRSADLEKYHEGEDLKDFFRFRLPKKFKQEGSGSGIIVSKEGYILTNVHVVDQAEKLQVTLYDNREFPADIVGLDPLTEVAVIKISADDLPVARLGDSEAVKVGQWVLAVGNPLELRSTVTAGIISAKERQIDIISDNYGVESFLQTDAAINPGNSGGALVNLRGEVIGVNTAIATETGYNVGFGFAIPISLANKIMTDIIKNGEVERGYLGIGMQNVNEKIARGMRLGRPMGVFISQVLEDGPAENAGVRLKDVLIKIDDQVVNRSNQVQAIIATKHPGDAVHLSLIRKGEPLELDVVLGKKEIETREIAVDHDAKDFENLGLRVKDMTRQEAADLVYSGPAGVIVTEVEKWSPASEAGIVEGDILIEIDDIAISNASGFREVIAGLGKSSVSVFTIHRNQGKYFFFVEVP